MEGNGPLKPSEAAQADGAKILVQVMKTHLRPRFPTPKGRLGMFGTGQNWWLVIPPVFYATSLVSIKEGSVSLKQKTSYSSTYNKVHKKMLCTSKTENP